MLGVGAELCGDDVIGVLVAKRVQALARAKRVKNIAGFVGGSAPENVTGEIVRFAPTHLVLVDAAFLGLSPGQGRLIGPEEIEGISFSTHSLPAPIILDYLEKATRCVSIVVGVEPKTTEFLAPPTAGVLKAAERLAQAFF